MSETCAARWPIDACQLSLSVCDYRGYSYPTSMALTLWCGPAKPGLHGEHHGIAQVGVRGSHMDFGNEMYVMGTRLQEIEEEKRAEDHIDTNKPQVIMLSSNLLFPEIVAGCSVRK